LHEEKKITDLGIEATYDIRDQLGSGTFATVKLCINKCTGEKYAVKIIDKKKFALNHGSSRSDALMDEVKILKALSHPHVIKIYDTYETEQHLYLVLELITGGDLFDKIVDQKCGYSEPRARTIFGQILNAISYLHSNNIVHRDLKPENILLARKEEDNIKISDFGLSRVIGEGSFMKTLCGTPQYLAPEVLCSTSIPSQPATTTTGYDKSVDLWSLGVILYILLSGVPPFDERKNLLDQVKTGAYYFPPKRFQNVSSSAIDLIKRLLCIDPKKRITVEGILKHPWLLNDEDKEDKYEEHDENNQKAKSNNNTAIKRKRTLDDNQINKKIKIDSSTKERKSTTTTCHERIHYPTTKKKN